MLTWFVRGHRRLGSVLGTGHKRQMDRHGGTLRRKDISRRVSGVCGGLGRQKRDVLCVRAVQVGDVYYDRRVDSSGPIGDREKKGIA